MRKCIICVECSSEREESTTRRGSRLDSAVQNQLEEEKCSEDRNNGRNSQTAGGMNESGKRKYPR